jgi:transcriptional regulator with XRE-family HTH domain
MERRTIARALRALRRRRRWSQRTLANRLGISQPTMSRRERGALDRCTVPDLETWATALGAHLSLDIRSDGERPLSDARHAELQNWLIGLLRRAGWLADAEVSFNHYGDRGRIDIIAFLPNVGCLLVVEIKTRFTDAQEVLGRLDVKRRIAPRFGG